MKTSHQQDFPCLYFSFPLFIPLPSDLHYLSPSPSVPARNFHFLIHQVPQLGINFLFKNNPLHLIKAESAFSAALHNWSLAPLLSSNTALKKSCNHVPFGMSSATKRRFLFHLALPQYPFKSTPLTYPHHFIMHWHKLNP